MGVTGVVGAVGAVGVAGSDEGDVLTMATDASTEVTPAVATRGEAMRAAAESHAARNTQAGLYVLRAEAPEREGPGASFRFVVSMKVWRAAMHSISFATRASLTFVLTVEHTQSHNGYNCAACACVRSVWANPAKGH